MALTFTLMGGREIIAAEDVDQRVTGKTRDLGVRIREALEGVRCPKHDREPRSMHFDIGVADPRGSVVHDCPIADDVCHDLDNEVRRLTGSPVRTK